MLNVELLRGRDSSEFVYKKTIVEDAKRSLRSCTKDTSKRDKIDRIQYRISEKRSQIMYAKLLMSLSHELKIPLTNLESQLKDKNIIYFLIDLSYKQISKIFKHVYGL
ncbi:hypothetical protein AB834_01335 [PVC group bacterium (ex Bugula neritina AB1)]|nr:hypothetical protein AB834_01335 [PVC group bacterium (ex Bugula neritina AB1)]